MQLLDMLGKPIRKTFGEQSIDNTIKQIASPDKVEAGDAVKTFWKKLSRDMADGIAKTRKTGYKGIIYIQVKEKKIPNSMGANGDLYTIVYRKTRPTAEQATSLYIHREFDAEPQFQYCLPELSWVEGIMRNKHKFTVKYINDIQAWIEGRLK
jgi:hypothetical protein